MKTRVVIGRALLGIVAIVLAVSGIDHFVSYRTLAEYYATLGWPPSVTEVLGVLQLVGAAMLVVPRVQRLAAAIVSLILIVLIGRQLMRGQEMLFFAEPALWMTLACIVGALLVGNSPRSQSC